MAQIKIYGRHDHLQRVRTQLSDVIHAAAQSALGLPANKRFHRFIPMQPENFIHPDDRSDQYTVIEVSMFEGRSDETKRAFLRQLIADISSQLGISIQDIEITIFETPKASWGIRGSIADELTLNYKVET